MAVFRMPTPIRRPTSKIYWIRKKVPQDLRALVGRGEVWKSLETDSLKEAVKRCAALSLILEADWERLRAERRPAPPPVPATPNRLTHQDLHALRGELHAKVRAAYIKEPPQSGFGRARITTIDDETLHREAFDLLEEGGYGASPENLDRLKPLLLKARADAARDVEHARLGEYDRVTDLSKMPARTTPVLDFLAAFEEYAEKGGLKGKEVGPTAKRWRPKIKAFCDFLGHRDLTRMKTADGYRWVDHLIEKGFARKSIRDVWIASLSATAGFMVERRKLDQNPFHRIRVRDETPSMGAAQQTPQQPPRKGFTNEEARKILTATVATPSNLISEEMRAARRWLPWLCAYSGARVNELTSLNPRDISHGPDGIVCMIIKPPLEKTAKWRVVPIHSHVIEQGFLEYVERRQKLNMPLFYNPARSRGGKPGNPQFKKVAERIGEWVHGLGIPVGVKPNHGWRHLFKSVARHLKMDREVEGFITGHRPKDSNAGHDYGDKWIKTMSAEIERYPRFEIEALNSPAAGQKRNRRTKAELAKVSAAKQARKNSRAARATEIS